MPRMTLRKFFGLVPFLSTQNPIVRIGRRRVGALGGSRREYVAHKERARVLVHQKLLTLNQHYGMVFNKVGIRNQRSRWGSCSKKGNLNFNYRIIYLPEALQDYLIVHELCHLAMFNHSRQFWALVAEVIPDYEVRRRALTRYAKQRHGAIVAD